RRQVYWREFRVVKSAAPPSARSARVCALLPWRDGELACGRAVREARRDLRRPVLAVGGDELAHCGAERGFREGVAVDSVQEREREGFRHIAERGPARLLGAELLSGIFHRDRHRLR